MRDRYYFNNGVKSGMEQYRIDRDYLIRLLYIATKSLSEINHPIATNALEEIKLINKTP